ncbi:adenine-specific DNA-methyltransferase [Monaibacterium marinum]|uniref:site-specific DNA-methyltransferase (adenine-specific) n=1 Tax=Pontivivens marinum TaxID=1690039 RepID=A0A2C9CUP0_9RHOB|nr:Eco57I restriction-modification methylase domain-containing protein [Monaibacterium marinum]SOH95231.1 adenine-specific DNA-methyltransferase [Monaibacterium marinum]
MLLEFIDQTRLEVSPTLDPKRRSKLGQFMTPARIASFMAGMFGDLPAHIRLLDAGAGMGALTAAFVAESLGRETCPTSIDVTCYEVDDQLASILDGTLAVCADQCAGAGVAFTSRVVRDDYILQSLEPLLRDQRTYNYAILNPPYGKINQTSEWRLGLRSLGIETVNLYTAFVAVALQQIEVDGEIVAITPRSFCNGSYYEPFRRLLLDGSAISNLHVFESRRSSFKDDDVLQENMIFRVRKGVTQEDVTLSTDESEARAVSFSDIVRPSDRHAFIRLPVSGNDLADSVQALPCVLADLGIKVSTGRVVDFRTRDNLLKESGDDTVPLIYPQHFHEGGIRWPLPDFRKHNALADNEDTVKLIIPAGIYVLTKRFTAKEEKRRLVASIYDGGRAGFENHLNYFHENGEGLPLDLAKGLAAFLNSEGVDQYFRIFSGHTQVNATDLRNLHYPSRDQLEAFGRGETSIADLF